MLLDMCVHEGDGSLLREYRKKVPLWKRVLGIISYHDFLLQHLRTVHGEVLIIK